MATLNIISAGAMQAVVTTLIPVFEKTSGATVSATYGAVGQQKARVLAGEPADLRAALADPRFAALHPYLR
jgi:ABC-type molybdate transport system substrate-binding protein